MKIKSYLPVFPGFYGSVFEYESEEQDIENFNEENNTNLDYDDFEFDYEDYHDRVAQKCVEILERELKHDFPSISLKFIKLKSPREYNFRNDEIFVDYNISKKDFKALKSYLKANKDEFKQYLENNHSSYSGFISFLSSKYKVWKKEYLVKGSEKLGTCFGSVLQFYFDNENFGQYDLYDNLDGETYINYKVTSIN